VGKDPQVTGPPHPQPHQRATARPRREMVGAAKVAYSAVPCEPPETSRYRVTAAGFGEIGAVARWIDRWLGPTSYYRLGRSNRDHQTPRWRAFTLTGACLGDSFTSRRAATAALLNSIVQRHCSPRQE